MFGTVKSVVSVWVQREAKGVKDTTRDFVQFLFARRGLSNAGFGVIVSEHRL